MARRLNLEMDMNLALEGYNFESRLGEGFDATLDFGTPFLSNLTPLTLFLETSTGPSDITALSTMNEDNPLEAPQLPGQPLFNGPFGAVFELSSLLAVNGGDGSAGFVVNGIDVDDYSGSKVSSAGDINGDGFDDIIIGASHADPNGNNSGESYVVFGSGTSLGASFDLSTLNGTNGFVFNGMDAGHFSGGAVSSAGDINGDGFDDILVGASRVIINNEFIGQAYVIFGSNVGFAASLDPSDLNGANGFVINGIDAGDAAGGSVSSAGDINGDGIDDILIAAWNADPNGNESGESYVVFGSSAPFAASFDLSTLNGSNGFVINGIDANDNSGNAASAGDVNGDGFDDIIVGGAGADPNGNSSGESYIIFGRNSGFAASFELSSLDGSVGFILNGIDAYDNSGVSVSSAGDVNGDGFDDVIIGASNADPNGGGSGESYVVFGSSASFGASIELSALDGTNGFIINGVDPLDFSGNFVSSAGDINGDGFDDILIGAWSADPNGLNRAGESYVIFGSSADFASSINLSSLNGTNGFIIIGIDENDRIGGSVSSAGDVNGDGFDDIIIGARFGDPNGTSDAGETYVIYGQSSNAEFELSSLLAANGGDGSDGFVINGLDSGDESGHDVSSAGDINGDGFDDFIIGAYHADPNGSNSGETYVVFGNGTGFGPSFDLLTLDGTNGFVLNGIGSGDISGHSLSSAGDFNGDGFDDIIIGANHSDPNGINNAGESYVVYGKETGFASSLDLSSLNGTSGFVLNGIDSGDYSGSVSSAGDFNGDGFDDIIVGASRADPNGSNSGETYVVFGGNAGFSASFELSSLLAVNGGNGASGFVLNGIGTSDTSAGSISSAGDVNGDGFDDILIGVPLGDPNGSASGESYIVFGSDVSFGSSLELSSLNGMNGFVINGIDAGDTSGINVSSAGDINGDGFDDILIGARGADPDGKSGAGESYVVFGSGAGFAPSLNLSTLNGINGFVINGVEEFDQSSRSLSSAGDINGDGFDDVLIGAYHADNNGVSTGVTYVIFGTDAPFAPSLELSALDGSNGFDINGIDQSDYSSRYVSSAGDINGDGFDDIIIGAPGADPNGSKSGESYVIYGQADFGRTVEILSVTDDTYTASDNGEVVYGLAGNDVINGGTASDVLFGDEGDDTLNGNAGNDRLEGGAGNDILDGGDGQDIAIYTGNLSDYDIINNGDGTYTVTDNVNGNSVDTLSNIENVQIGTDIVDLSAILFAINGTVGNDNPLNGTADDDIINGLAGNDAIFGLAGDDEINGGDGADRLIGGEGADVLNGGAGFDSADYREATSSVRFNVDTGGTVGEAAGDTFSSLERYYLSNFNDIITGSSANEFFYGEDGNDQINGGGGIDRIYGGEGNDVQRGQDGNDTLYGSAGSDQLNGGTGFDVANYSLASAAVVVNMLTGGTGGDAAGDSYFGIEAVYGSNFDDFITGNNSANEIRGGEGFDTINGGGGNDRIFGSVGGDIIDGGAGTDIVNFTLATSAVGLILGGAGLFGEAATATFISIEWVFGSDFDDSITGDAENNRLEGRDGNDTLNGEAGNDRLLGGDGNDIINGGDGVDTIFGQDGDDVMTGGDGNDFFFGGAGADSHDGGTGTDTVSYLASSSGLTVNMSGLGTASTGDAVGDSFISIERIFGSGFDDNLIGDINDNTLLGNGGADYLAGGGGNDSLNGGAGIDSFGYDEVVDEADVIQGFTLNEVVYIFGGTVTDFASLQALGSDAGTNVIFNFGGGNTLTIVGHNLADLDASNFDFSGIPPAGEPLDNPDAFAADIVDVFYLDALI